jgi:hypothetical protein
VRGMRPASSSAPTRVCVLPVPVTPSDRKSRGEGGKLQQRMRLEQRVALGAKIPCPPITKTLTCKPAHQASVRRQQPRASANAARNVAVKQRTFCSFFTLEAMAGPISSNILSLRAQASFAGSNEL